MTSVHWFRKGLRLHDNPALLAAIEEGLELRPVYILDPISKTRVGENRWRFLVQALEDLNQSLKKLGTRLYVIRGKPEEVFTDLINEWNIKKLTWEVDTEPYAVKQDAAITEIAKKQNVAVVSKVGHTLYSTELLIQKNLGRPPLTMQAMQALVSKMGDPPKTLAEPSSLPTTAQLKDKDHGRDQYKLPTLKELKVDESKLFPCKFPGGETEALRRMDEYISNERKSWVCKFEKPKTSPNSLEPSTTVLSPYLKFGCLSPRIMYFRLKEIYSGNSHSQPPVSLMGQLLWREFFYVVGSATPNFDQMEGNPICRQIPWRSDPQLLDAWENAKTGYPFIDAVMTQLRQEGWVHHLARHSVACFLTRGDLFQSWEQGMKVFEELLLDADWSLNAGNWMWLSASAFFHQFFRVYSPVAFGKKTDNYGDYIRKYVPQLKKYPENYIYEPWKAPLSVQKAAGCIIGEGYPRRIVDHDIVRKRNLDWMGKAYAANKKDQGEKRPSDSSSKKQSAKKNKK